PRPTLRPLFPYTTLFRSREFESSGGGAAVERGLALEAAGLALGGGVPEVDLDPHRVQEPEGQSAAPPEETAQVEFDGVALEDPRSEEHTSELQSPYDLVC